MKKIPIVCMIVLICLTVGFIFSKSLPDQETSKSESDRVGETIVKPVLSPVIGEENVTGHLVRKLAHFSEFFTLGAEVSVLLWLLRKKNAQAYINALAFGSAVALCDETIQIFTKRGSQVQDVWLDIGGVACGIAVVLCIRILVFILMKRKAAS